MKLIIVPDVHLTTESSNEYKLVKKFISRQKPDEVVLLGDFMDCASLSHWDDNKARVIEGKRFKEEVRLANKELDFLQRYSGKVTYLEGNHENWVEQYIDKHPEMEGIIELPLSLHLADRGIEWCPYNELYKVGKLYFTHGCYITKYHANKHMQVFGCNIVYGHTHNTQTAMHNMKMQHIYQAYGLGCLCDHKPKYMKNRPANWINQFAVVYIDDTDGDFNLYPVNIINSKFIWNGVTYR